ncbi:MAG: hypothetical protein ABIH03_08230 [Pseudomonadota bacterium]
MRLVIPAKDRSCFRRFFIDGGAVVRPNGAGIENPSGFAQAVLAGKVVDPGKLPLVV